MFESVVLWGFDHGIYLKQTHNMNEQLAHSWGGIVLGSALGR